MRPVEYDIALSFAGEDREYVDQVANLLRNSGVAVFYDLFEEASLWGKNLYDYLSDIYENKARYTIMFISEHYARKLWTNREREAMQARAFKEHQEYILPARFDDTPIPGILPTVGYIALTNHPPQEFVETIHKKLVNSGCTIPLNDFLPRVECMLKYCLKANMPHHVPNDVFTDLLGWARDRSDSPFGVLLGEYGTGKTWNSQLLALTLIECLNNKEPNIPTPIYLDLSRAVDEKSRLLSGDVPTLEDLLESLSRNNTPPGGMPLTVEEIFRAVRKERALLILDSLDEVLAHKRDDAWGQTFIKRLFDVLPLAPNFSHVPLLPPGTGKLLLTCRTHYFKDAQTQNDQILGLVHKAARPRAWRLLPFTKEQILKYLELHVPDQDPQAIYELIASVHNLSEIASRPQGINMVCAQIGEIETAKRKGETVDGATIYAWMVNKWLARDHGKHRMHEDVKRKLMQDLALHMWQLGVRRITWEDLSEWFSNKLQLGIQAQDVEPFLTDLRNATFLVRPGKHDFTFAHASILEYFFAVRLHRSLEEDDVGIWEDLDPSREALNFLLQHHQTCPSYRKEKARDTLAKHLGQDTAGEVARKSWLNLFLLAPEEWPLKTLDISELSLEKRVFSHLTLDTLIADRANLAGTKWSHCHFRHSSWRYADCRQTQCESITGNHADFSHANLFGGRWRHINIAKTNFDEALHLDTFQRSPTTAGWSPSRFQPFGWRLQWNEQSKCLRVLKEQESWLNVCSVSSDGQRIVTAGSNGTVCVWNEQGECLHVLKECDSGVHACSVSADRRRIITAGDDGAAHVWDEQGKRLHVLKGHEGAVRACSVSADGRRIITAGDDHTARVWNEQGECLHVLKGHEGWVLACAVSADGRRFITAGVDRTARVWNEQGKCLHILKGHENWVLACSVNVDGRHIITAGTDGTARAWNGKGKCLHVLKGHTGWVRACSVSADGQRFITAGDDRTARVWNEQGECLHVLKGHDSAVLTCSVSADGRRMITASKDATRTRFWVSDDVNTCKCTLELHPLTGTIVWLDAKTQTLKVRGPDWPFWQLTYPVSRVHALGETIAEFGPMGHEQLANAEEWQFLPRDDIQPDDGLP